VSVLVLALSLAPHTPSGQPRVGLRLLATLCRGGCFGGREGAGELSCVRLGHGKPRLGFLTN
jgi:hypothetical protein